MKFEICDCQVLVRYMFFSQIDMIFKYDAIVYLVVQSVFYCFIAFSRYECASGSWMRTGTNRHKNKTLELAVNLGLSIFSQWFTLFDF